jgi:hypothetical protein
MGSYATSLATAPDGPGPSPSWKTDVPSSTKPLRTAGQFVTADEGTRETTELGSKPANANPMTKPPARFGGEEFGHGTFGKVAAVEDLPLIVEFGHDRSGQPVHGGRVGEDLDHIGPPFDLPVEPLQWVRRPVRRASGAHAAARLGRRTGGRAASAPSTTSAGRCSKPRARPRTTNSCYGHSSWSRWASQSPSCARPWACRRSATPRPTISSDRSATSWGPCSHPPE